MEEKSRGRSARLDFTAPSGGSLTRSGAGIKIHSSSSKILAALGELMKDPTYALERKATESFAELLVELARRNDIAAPFRSEITGLDDGA